MMAMGVTDWAGMGGAGLESLEELELEGKGLLILGWRFVWCVLII